MSEQGGYGTTRMWQGLMGCSWGTQPGATHLVFQDVECHGVLPFLLSASWEGVCCTGQRRGRLVQVQNPFHQPTPTLFASQWPVGVLPQPPPKDPSSPGSYLGCSSPCSAVFVRLVEEGALQSWLPCRPDLPFPSSPLL